MRRALYDIYPGLIERLFYCFIDLALERLCPVWNHVFYGFSVVAFVLRHKSDSVTDSDF
ncbi:hypothetical protein AGR3A_pa20010 [Agrobacterium tomkonis CFBP 6623]|uniref:Uncharacterized protein n=1 Tax=Agrobacterium tomkonis CFBP 6623 TaxID=1183432 RepID=A0A1S7S8L9_9HYPH|nr:hypothetical protein AGR3A_pa20010 [Agrobacterium tomkonis CFBP 6623]